ncbi:MAG: penicillin-binding transpeptidase domain-containing protein [Pseudomonadota bacterium]
MTSQKRESLFYRYRYFLVHFVVFCLFVLVLLRAAQVQVIDFDFLRDQGEARIKRQKVIPAYRGVITDRNGYDLAISIPVQSLWVNPSQLIQSPKIFADSRWHQLAVLLEKSSDELTQWVKARGQRQFVYIERHLAPEVANYIRRLNIPGVNLLGESKRFYPSAEVTAHVIGFTGIEDQGLEGIEKSFDTWLTGEQGLEWVTKDRLGRVIAHDGVAKPMRPGKNLALSLDLKIQTAAYRELKRTVKQFEASSGSMVILDVHTGEVLAMVNQPSFNPNLNASRLPNLTRNRALLDIFEPGSTAKTFTVLSGLEFGDIAPNTIIDTSPGIMRVGGSWVRDGGANYGKLDLAGVLRKSSNIGSSKIALKLTTEQLLAGFYAVGFGLETGVGFPGESQGIFATRTRWSQFERAALSYGYGVAVTALQLARAYSVIANGGYLLPITLLKHPENHGFEKKRVISETNAKAVVAMLEEVVSEEGTGKAARLRGYRVAGKTGTNRIAAEGGYTSNYTAIFAGIAPLESPRLAAVVVIDNPAGDYYHGGETAAPTYARVMRQALRIINAAPDKVEKTDIRLASHQKRVRPDDI